MSTNPRDMERSKDTYEQINHQFVDLNLAALSDNTLLAECGDPVQRLLTIYRGVSPFLTALCTLPLFPLVWRTALQLFIAALEGVAAAADPTFKAGKDLRRDGEEE